MFIQGHPITKVDPIRALWLKVKRIKIYINPILDGGGQICPPSWFF